MRRRFTYLIDKHSGIVQPQRGGMFIVIQLQKSPSSVGAARSGASRHDGGSPIAVAFLTSAAFLLLSFIAPAATNQPAQKPDQTSPSQTTASPTELIQLRGKVVCLPEEMNRLHQASLPTGHEHLYGFKADDRKYYTLLRTKFSEALFVDQRFREKELLIKGRVFPDTQIFEPTVIRSVRNGVVHDLYYYCDICDIQAVAPGPCECCQGPTELIEKPLQGFSP